MLINFLVFAATFFGVGRIPKAPGTFGTLAALPIAALLLWLGPLWQMGVTLAFIPFAIFASEAFEKKMGTHDSSQIVIDEVAGLLVTMMWLPMTWQSFVAGFILFRFFDILKPYPISYLDKKIQGGVGVVADDLLAGVFASLILQVLLVKTSLLGVQIIGDF